MEQKMKKVFARVLNIPVTEVGDGISYNSLKTWDSLKHLELIGELETEFGINIETDDIIAMENFKVAKAIIGKYLAKSRQSRKVQ